MDRRRTCRARCLTVFARNRVHKPARLLEIWPRLAVMQKPVAAGDPVASIYLRKVQMRGKKSVKTSE